MPEQNGNKDAGDYPAALGTQRQALDELFSAAYEELRRMAIAAKRSRVNPAVSTGTLIHAAWLKLAAHNASHQNQESTLCASLPERCALC